MHRACVAQEWERIYGQGDFSSVVGGLAAVAGASWLWVVSRRKWAARQPSPPHPHVIAPPAPAGGEDSYLDLWQEQRFPPSSPW